MEKSKSRLLKQILFVLMDCGFSLFAWFMAVWFYSYLFISAPPLLDAMGANILPIMGIGALVFFLFGMYKNMWRYASVGTVLRVTASAVTATFATYVYFRLVMGFWQSPAIPVMAAFILTALCGTARLFPRIYQYLRAYFYYRRKKISSALTPALVVGAGRAASILLTDMLGRMPQKYAVLAIVDDDKNKHKLSLHGVDVVGGAEMIPDLVEQLGIRKIIICIPSATNKQMQRILALCPTSKCTVSVIPATNDLEKTGAGSLRDINTADLLGRSETNIDTSAIASMLAGKTVLVTGGGGSIGSELCRQLLNFDLERLVLFDIYENNAYDLYQEVRVVYGEAAAAKLALRIGSVQDAVRLEEVFSEFRPAVVFHAAAYKHVPLMEQSPRQAVLNNVFGTMGAARLAGRYGAEKFILVSTDKAVNPANIMGATKRMAELATLSQNGGDTAFACVRFGNVLASNGSVIPIFEKQLAHGGPLTVTHPEVTRYFMTISEAAKLVIQSAQMAKGGEIFILDMGEPVKIADLAENMIRLAGYVPGEDIRIEFTGLRPGEKLYEEVLMESEDIRDTANEKIFMAQAALPALSEAEKMMDDLAACLETDERLMDCIRAYVPGYAGPREGGGA